MLCVTPYESFIDNIGCDGSGVHCGRRNLITPMRKENDTREILLPDIVEITEDSEAAYADAFCWTLPEIKLNCYNRILFQWNLLLQKRRSIIEYFLEQDIGCIAIWGRGNLCKLILNELKDKIVVKYIIESKAVSRQYEGISVISPDYVTDDVQIIVVIPIYDMERIKKRINSNYKNKLIGIDNILQYFQ